MNTTIYIRKDNEDIWNDLGDKNGKSAMVNLWLHGLKRPGRGTTAEVAGVQVDTVKKTKTEGLPHDNFLDRKSSRLAKQGKPKK